MVMTLGSTHLHRERATEMPHVTCIFTRMLEDYGQTFTSMIWQFVFKQLQELHPGLCVSGVVKEKLVIREDVFHVI